MTTRPRVCAWRSARSVVLGHLHSRSQLTTPGGGLMAAINDNANVFVGQTLELFNAMQVVVARDGDVGYAQLVLGDAMKKLLATTQLAHSPKAGAAVGPRKP
jgi:hypothetical protein